MLVLLVSTYELGRQPFGLASPAAWLRDAGFEVRTNDLSREPLDASAAARAGLIGFYLPMHTATRLALPHLRAIRDANPAAALCAFGLYAPLNAALLGELGVAHVLGGEFEAELLAVAQQVSGNGNGAGPIAEPPHAPHHGRRPLPRLAFRVPDRSALPPLERYAALRRGDDERRVAGYTEGSRGCKHMCRHCPIVPVYQGRFRIVPLEVVIADVRQQVAAGAQHITFGDPDFFNGIRHATAIADAMRREFPGVTYDVTVKVEHLLEHAGLLPRLRESGCILVTSAFEAFDDLVLDRLEKGHTAADAERAVALCRTSGLALQPTFVAFTPWTTLAGYRHFLETLERLELVDAVPSVQLALRLLIPNGSPLLELDDVARAATCFDPRSLVHRWRHQDAAVDALQRQVERVVGVAPGKARRDIFDTAYALTCQAMGTVAPRRGSADVLQRAEIPWLEEPWYC